MFCEKCGEYIFRHRDDKKCNCELFVVTAHEDEGGEDHRYFAFTETGAVEKYAKNLNDEADYMGEEIICFVNGKKYCVIPEPDIHYSISEVEN